MHPRLVRLATEVLVLVGLVWLGYGLWTHPALAGGALVLAIGPLAVIMSVYAVARGVDRLVARFGGSVRSRRDRANADDGRPIYRTRLPLTGLWIEIRQR